MIGEDAFAAIIKAVLKTNEIVDSCFGVRGCCKDSIYGHPGVIPSAAILQIPHLFALYNHGCTTGRRPETY